jgi:carbamoyltransferase
VKKEKYKDIAAIVHQDYTCRIQTVTQDDGIFYTLLNAFHKLSGITCLLNTSFNLSGEPLVESPEQALADFKNSSMDILVLNNYILSKKN